MKKICVQGLGFVGAAVSIALAQAKTENGDPLFEVIGIDVENAVGKQRINLINQGVFPFPNYDPELKEATQAAVQKGNLKAVSDLSCYQNADYIIVSVPFNFASVAENEKAFLWEDFKNAIRQFARIMQPECLIIVETTVPPGTCRQVILPILQEEFCKRNIRKNPLLAHSYERVMPGANYLRSITKFYRCYAGIDDASANLCEDFLSQFIYTKEYPLTRLSTLEASELAKVLENSYRAVTIAFMEEWAEFAERINVNLYEVINAIRMRPTHSNIRQPGFGVGGYCLTKDPLFAQQASKEIYGFNDVFFPFCELAVRTNQQMPSRCFTKLKSVLGNLEGKTLLLLGISYKSDIGDARFSPSAVFLQEAIQCGMKVTCHDPFVSYWDEMNIHINMDLNKLDFRKFDVVVIAVPHSEYQKIDFIGIKSPNTFIFDACGLLKENQLKALKDDGHQIFVIGRGNI